MENTALGMTICSHKLFLPSNVSLCAAFYQLATVKDNKSYTQRKRRVVGGGYRESKGKRTRKVCECRVQMPSYSKLLCVSQILQTDSVHL